MSSLRQLVGQGWIGPVLCDGHEILRRMFVTVRDRNWSEVSPCEFRTTFDSRVSTIHVSARHTSDLVDFAWEGRLVVEEYGRRLRFAFRGHALRDMDVCRLGLVVLHPVESMVGARLVASREAASQSLTIERRLAPQPIIDGLPGAMTEPFSALSIERDDFGTLQLSFEGDLFEIEDQRNWGDTSFKTYCTPLRYGFPRAITSGTVIEQSVEVKYAPAEGNPRISVRQPETEIEPQALRLPTLGRIASRIAPASAYKGDVWDHVHVDLTGENPGALAALFDASHASHLEIGLHPAQIDQPTEWLRTFRANPERIARLLFYGPGVSLPAPSTLAFWRDAVRDATGRAIPILAATQGYFVELNRGVPLQMPIDGIAFPLTATVHGEDPELLMSNVAAIRDMAATARQLTGQREVVIAPLAFHHPPSATRPSVPETLIRDWAAATLRHAMLAQVTSITLSDDVLDLLRFESDRSVTQALRDWMGATAR